MLSDQLQASLAQSLANSQAVPRGLTAFSQTAEMSAGQPDQTASALVGTAAPSFTLQLDATADVTAVNEAQINDIATAKVNAAVAPGQKLVGNAVSVSHDGGTVVGDTVVYHVQASGQGYTNPDPQALIAAVKGKSLVDARAALARYGAAEIDVWPDFIDHLPDQAARISINVITPSAAPATPALTTPIQASPVASSASPSAS
jgi:hypothetical protein